MKYLAGIFAAVALMLPASASSHLYGFCGHYNKVYNNGNALAQYQSYSFSNGTHWHIYKHYFKTPGGYWSYAHSYSLNCNGYV